MMRRARRCSASAVLPETGASTQRGASLGPSQPRTPRRRPARSCSCRREPSQVTSPASRPVVAVQQRHRARPRPRPSSRPRSTPLPRARAAMRPRSRPGGRELVGARRRVRFQTDEREAGLEHAPGPSGLPSDRAARSRRYQPAASRSCSLELLRGLDPRRRDSPSRGRTGTSGGRAARARTSRATSRACRSCCRRRACSRRPSRRRRPGRSV